MSQFQDALGRVSQYFAGSSQKQQQMTSREAKTEAAYSKRPPRFLGQRAKTQNRSQASKLKGLIGEVQRADLGVEMNRILSNYYSQTLADTQAKLAEATQRKAIAERSQQTYGYSLFLPPPTNPEEAFTAFSKPSWAAWGTPKDEIKRQQEFIDAYTADINKYTPLYNEAATKEQTVFESSRSAMEEQRSKVLKTLGGKLQELDLTAQQNVQQEARTPTKPNLPADRVRRTSSLTPKVDQPSMFEDRPL